MRIIPNLSAAQRAEFIAACRSLLVLGPDGGPVPWKHCGRSTRGIDCVGVPAFGFAAIGVDVDDLSSYDRAPDGKLLREYVQRHLGNPIARPRWRPGDIALMRWFESKERTWHNHVGVLTETPYGALALLHSHLQAQIGDKTIGGVIEHRLSTPWDRRVHEVYSLTDGGA